MSFKNKDLDKIIKNSTISENKLEFQENDFAKFSYENAQYIDENTGKRFLFKLPHSEIQFFDWLKEADPLVWNDLWKSDDLNESPYYVSTIFLPLIIENKDRGFPICDLRTVDNYYFTIDHMVDEESKVFMDVSKAKLENRSRMTTTELLSLEISLAPIDIWHFAYKFKLDLNQCKEAVHSLSKDNALVHLREAEHIAPFIKF
jgi:hypothetical protein